MYLIYLEGKVYQIHHGDGVLIAMSNSDDSKLTHVDVSHHVIILVGFRFSVPSVSHPAIRFIIQSF